MTKEAIITTLEAEISSLERLLVTLKDEQSILISAHIDRLGDLLPLKAQLLTELESATEQRRQAFVSHGAKDSAQGMADWITENRPAALQLWENLVALAQQASHYNRSNGQLIQNREEAQRIFMNGLTRNTETAYSATGHVISASKRRPLDQV